MPVLLKQPDCLLPIAGIRLAACSAGIYKYSRDDIVLIEMTEGSTCAAVFTKNAFSAAPVKIARAHLQTSDSRYCLINAGNANAGTGERGYHDAMAICQTLANQTGCETEQVLPFSTGVIGEYLPVASITGSFDKLISLLDEKNWLASARAIMTTDVVAKGVSKTVMLEGKAVQITGIAKGSGMIRPDMATMLAFIACDADIEEGLLNDILKNALAISFNRICVDGDTSTNDACLLIATGKSEVSIRRDNSPLLKVFQEAIDSVFVELSHAIVRDGEGATKFITVKIMGGRSETQCLDIAYDIATSPLVKTAMYASDPNWGRIIAAIGRSREGQIDPAMTSVFLNELCIFKKGKKAEDYTEEAGQVEMAKAEIMVIVDLGLGQYSETIWTCDLSHDYIKINSNYRS
ncbi:MAG: glutamate N-acetyltransferase/amino-acid N-acetyltransferase [Gammaproteobacteria bacterium]